MLTMTRTFHPVGHGAFYTEEFVAEGTKYTMVYDCGRTKIKEINGKIDSAFRKGQNIDIVFISHFHTDHINGLKYLLENFNVKRIVLPLLHDEQKIELFLSNQDSSTFVQDMCLNPKTTMKQYPNTRVTFVTSKVSEKNEKSIDISNMGFDVFPDISRFTNITYIQASGNNLREIKLSSKNIKHLEVLDIRENNIETLHIGKAPNLKNAYLAANPLKRIPFSFVFNKKLEMIEISKTQISLLPWWLKYKKNITELIINGGIFEISSRNSRRMRQLKTLTLAHLIIDSLPNNFSKLHKLERLTIAYTHLHSLPDIFYKL